MLKRKNVTEVNGKGIVNSYHQQQFCTGKQLMNMLMLQLYAYISKILIIHLKKKHEWIFIIPTTA